MVILTFLLLTTGSRATDFLHRITTGRLGPEAEEGDDARAILPQSSLPLPGGNGAEANNSDACSCEAERLGHLRAGAWLTFLLLCVSVVGGMASNSLALFAQSLYLFSDIGEGVLSIWAVELSAKPGTLQYSFGVEQLGALGTFLMVMLLWTMASVLLVQALHRLTHPEVVYGPIVAAVAGFGLVWRLVTSLLFGHGRADLATVLSRGTGHNPQRHAVRAAAQDLAASRPAPEEGCSGHQHGHGPSPSASLPAPLWQSHRFHGGVTSLVAELVEMFLVALTGALLWWQPITLGATEEGVTDWSYLDTIATLLCVVLTLLVTRRALSVATRQLLMACPRHLDIEAFREDLLNAPGVVSLHDLHIWQISHTVVCSAHIVVEENSQCDEALRKCTEVAQGTYQISRPTFQMEVEDDFAGGGERLRLNATTCHDTTF